MMGIYIYIYVNIILLKYLVVPRNAWLIILLFSCNTELKHHKIKMVFIIILVKYIFYLTENIKIMNLYIGQFI